MLETPAEAAERLLFQVRSRGSPKKFYVAFGSSMKFIAFTQGEYAYSVYGEDIERLVGCYRKGVPVSLITEDITAFLTEKGFIK